MKRATISLPDDLSEAVDDYIQSQEVRPALTTVVQTALREYLGARGFLRARRPLKLRALGGSGLSDVSINHDYYLARDSRKVSKSAAPAKRARVTRNQS
jgi:metal-responsive CopG/Arc/MetJ family transcriptional regulator